MKIFKKDVRSYSSIFIIGDVASGHEGKVELAEKLADATKKTGADAVNYQMLKADNLLVPSHHKYQRFKEIEFKGDEWHRIINYARSIGLPVIAEVFDEESFKLACELKVEVFKIPTSDLTNPFLLKEAAATQKTLILSIGAATQEEINFAVKICESAGNFNLVLMHGFQNFPTKIEDTNLRLLEFLKETYKYDIGFADHIDAESELALYFPLLAIGQGASVIEKHITLDRSLKGRDYYSALNPGEFIRFVSQIRLIEKAYSIRDPDSEAQKIYRNLMKKKVVAKHDIRRDTLISEEDISFKRVDDEGLLPSQYKTLLKKARRILPRDSTIKETDVY